MLPIIKAVAMGLSAINGIASMRSMMTDGMLQEIKTQLAEREANASGQPNQTDVVMLDAQLLGIEEVNGFYMASVEFSGMIREDASAGPGPFREVWNMTRPTTGGNGLLARSMPSYSRMCPPL